MLRVDRGECQAGRRCEHCSRAWNDPANRFDPSGEFDIGAGAAAGAASGAGAAAAAGVGLAAGVGFYCGSLINDAYQEEIDEFIDDLFGPANPELGTADG